MFSTEFKTAANKAAIAGAWKLLPCRSHRPRVDNETRGGLSHNPPPGGAAVND
jgi:hypothetical protein